MLSFQRQRAYTKTQRVTLKRVVNDDTRYNLISLLIELGDSSHQLDKVFGFPRNGLYDHFFTGKYLRTQKSMSLLMTLIDFGVSLEMPEALELHQNLYKFCGAYGSENEVSADDETDWTASLEKSWAYKLVDIFHRLGNPKKTAPNFLFRHLLSKLNKVSKILYDLDNDPDELYDLDNVLDELYDLDNVPDELYDLDNVRDELYDLNNVPV